MSAVRLMLLVAVGFCLAACSMSAGSTAATRRATDTTNTASRATVTTQGPPPVISVPTTIACLSGTVTLTFQDPGQLRRTCIEVGSTLVMTGGGNMSAGTWPGPPDISDMHVLTLVSSHGGTDFIARFKAIGPGASSVEVPFVAGPDVCNPTPCTPVPGAPLLLQVTVVTG
jgi:hypothetical protein